MAIDWLEKEATENQAFAPMTMPVPEGTWAFFDSDSTKRDPSPSEPRYVLIQPQVIRDCGLSNMCPENGGWVQVPRDRLRVGMTVTKDHRGEKRDFNIDDRGTCGLYTTELPKEILVTPTWYDSERGFESGKRP